MEDFNNADPQRDVIPPDTIVTLQNKVRAGNAGEDGWLAQSQDGKSKGLDLEYTVVNSVDKKYIKRKLFEWLVLDGPTEGHAEAARISQSKIRAMLESARGIRPDDKSEAAIQARRIANYGELDGMRFIARLGVEPARNSYAAKNRVAEVITPERRDWQRVEQTAKSATPSAPTAAKPASTPAPIARPQWGR
jgi:hypothetical protein